MTDRKPPGMSFDDWVRLQIRTGEARGVFTDLPLTGKPIPERALRLDRDWVSDLVERERLDMSVLLPPSIILAREAEQLRDRLAGERSESRVREIVEDLDDRIRAAYRQVLTGPPMRTRPLDVEAVIDRWRSTRPVEPAPSPAVPAVPAPPAVAVGTTGSRLVPAAVALLLSCLAVAVVAVLAR